MSAQVITVRPDGSLFGLDHKRKGLQFRQLGRAETRRETLIEWDAELQAWYIEWFTGPRKGQRWTTSMVPPDLRDNTTQERVYSGTMLNAIAWFADYEDAVVAEVAVVQGLQRQGGLPL
jgi:hypothetical protein